MSIGAEIRGIGATGREVLRALGRDVRGHGSGAAGLFEQMHAVGNQSVFFIVVTLGFLGAIFTFQTGFQGQRVLGDNSLIGATTLPLLVRQLAPTLCGMMVATRVGTGIAAELGSMVVTEQIDALRLSSARPIDALVKPRVLACAVMVPALCVLAVLVAFASGMVTAATFFRVNPVTYARLDLVRSYDVLEGLAKATAYGLTIPIIASYHGLRARGGSAGVGRATTRAVVSSSFAVITLDLLIGAAVFVLIDHLG